MLMGTVKTGSAITVSLTRMPGGVQSSVEIGDR